MANEVIVPGVGVGGMTEKYDIKILICYLLSSVPSPLSREELNAVFQDEQLVNYFSFCDALSELLESGHLHREDEVLVLDELGRETAKRLDRSLPSSLRDRVVETAMRLLARRKIEQENQVDITPYQNGFQVHCTMHDADFDLLRLSMYAPDRAQADAIKARLLEDPSRIYQGLIELLLG